ncbi:hypothetical protein AB7M47_005424 [Bradyrhizobium elkanii]
MKPSKASSGSVIRPSHKSSRIAASAAARSASEPAITQRRDTRSASRPAGIANRMKGSVSAVCNRPVWPSPTPSSSTATIGAAASAICSADCAARLDQARRLKVAGRRGVSADMTESLIIRLPGSVWLEEARSHPFPDNTKTKARVAGSTISVSFSSRFTL